MRSDDGGYDPLTETYRAHVDWTNRGSPSAGVIETVAALADTEPDDIETLHGVVDPDALDALFEPTERGVARRSEGTVSFVLEGYEVTVRASGEIIVDLSGENEATDLA